MASVIEISYKTVTSCTEPSARRKDLLWSLFLADNYQFMTFNAFSFNGLYLFSFNGTVNFVIVTFVWSGSCKGSLYGNCQIRTFLLFTYSCLRQELFIFCLL